MEAKDAIGMEESTNRCALCGEISKLSESHIIPKFIFNWLKDTSATGYLRQAIKPNLRIQDGIKKELLCLTCENKFSVYEKYFAENIFYPFVNKKKTSFQYNKNLMLFQMSIAWRLITSDLGGLRSFCPKMYPYIEKAEHHWHELLQKEEVDKIYSHHVFFVHYIQEAPKDLPPKFQAYMHRLVDATLVASDQEAWVFIKLPSMIMASQIYPPSSSTWINTLIDENGAFSGPQQILDSGFYGFLLSRLRIVQNNPISLQQQKRITETMAKGGDRALNSKSFELFLEECKRKSGL